MAGGANDERSSKPRAKFGDFRRGAVAAEVDGDVALLDGRAKSSP